MTKLALVQDTPKDDYPDQIAVARITAQCLVQMPFDEMAKRAENDRMKAMMRPIDQKELDRTAQDVQIIAVLAFAQKQLAKIEKRYSR